MKNYYQTLGIAEGASQEEIQEAYDSLRNELDPSKNNNQEFFLEEFEKLQEAYKFLRNSSILATEGGINNSNVKPTSSSKSIKNKNEFNKESKKINLLQWLIKEKKKIILFILVTLFVKIVIHFFIFPTETLVLNIDKKVFVQALTYDDRIHIRQGIGHDDKNGNKLIVYGNNFFYYPKELKKVSVGEHISMTFSEKLWLFPCIIILLLSLFWINNKADIENNKKQNFSSHFSKLNIIILLLLSLSIVSNVYLFIKINNGNDKVQTNESEEAQIYMNKAEDYMNNAEEYMNNAAQSAQEAEEYANNR